MNEGKNLIQSASVLYVKQTTTYQNQLHEINCMLTSLVMKFEIFHGPSQRPFCMSYQYSGDPSSHSLDEA